MARETAGNLRVARGERVQAQHHNGLVGLAESLTIQRGRLKGRQDSDGFTARIAVTAKAAVEHAWKSAIDEEDNRVFLRILTPSHVNGVVPEINGNPIDIADKNGEYPRYEIPKSAWAKRGLAERAHIYLRYDLRHEDFSIERITLTALPEPPRQTPWTWHKLFGWLTRQDGSIKWHPQMFFPEYFDVSQTDRQRGTFKPWPRV